MIDFTQIPVLKLGVGVYAYNLVRNLLRVDSRNEYFVIIQDDDPCLDELESERFTLVRVKSRFFRNKILRFFLEQLYIPHLIIRYGIDVMHSLHYSFPSISFRAKKVVTVHDMTFYLFPKMHIPIKRVYFKAFIRLSSLLADRIITDSVSTMNDYVRLLRHKKDNITAIHLGYDDRFHPGLDRSEIARIKKKYGIEGEYLLFIGAIEPRKNIKSIIIACNRLLNDGFDLTLVIAGPKGWAYSEILETAGRLGLSRHVVFTGFLQESEKPYLLEGAAIFIYPSFYEGFGIPVLEAMACGVPTITSNVSSMPEITGDAAILVDPQNVEDLYLKTKELLTDNRKLDVMKKKSVDQAGNFSWTKTAQETLGVYNTMG